jgi:hypothetical protein
MGVEMGGGVDRPMCCYGEPRVPTNLCAQCHFAYWHPGLSFPSPIPPHTVPAARLPAGEPAIDIATCDGTHVLDLAGWAHIQHHPSLCHHLGDVAAGDVGHLAITHLAGPGKTEGEGQEQ